MSHQSFHSHKPPLENTTHFGFETVPLADKARRVRAVFDSVCDRYDLMNDLMSGGCHRLWKRFALNLCQPCSAHRVLDAATGTGDLALSLAQTISQTGQIIALDINAAMLSRARCRLLDAGMISKVQLVQGDVQSLPFSDNYFDRIIIGFGLRNVTDKTAALATMWRCLRPGGWTVILEFSQPQLPPLFDKLYEMYSFKILPKLGRYVANNAASYRYLSESIRQHPNQTRLKEMMESVGYQRCAYYNLLGGIVAAHRGYKV